MCPSSNSSPDVVTSIPYKQKKLLTVAIPAYNSEAYLANCLDSLLPCRSQLDIIVVNDGSTDGTPALAAQYQTLYPQDIKLISQPNGGHGAGINTALAHASAPWFKVLDSDDRFDLAGLKELLQLLAQFCHEPLAGAAPDLIITDFVYEIHQEIAQLPTLHKKTQRYHNVFTPHQLCTWQQMGSFKLDQMLMMHALCLRTSLLHELAQPLPEHCYYEDNVYVYQSLTRVKNIYYLDESVYLYFIGRKDQSVNPANLLKNVQMQIRVSKEMLQRVQLQGLQPPKLRRYLYRHLLRMLVMCLMPLALEGSPQSLAQIAQLWKELEEIDPYITNKLRLNPLLATQTILAKGGRSFNRLLYSLVAKAFTLG